MFYHPSLAKHIDDDLLDDGEESRLMDRDLISLQLCRNLREVSEQEECCTTYSLLEDFWREKRDDEDCPAECNEPECFGKCEEPKPPDCYIRGDLGYVCVGKCRCNREEPKPECCYRKTGTKHISELPMHPDRCKSCGVLREPKEPEKSYSREEIKSKLGRFERWIENKEAEEHFFREELLGFLSDNMAFSKNRKNRLEAIRSKFL